MWFKPVSLAVKNFPNIHCELDFNIFYGRRRSFTPTLYQVIPRLQENEDLKTGALSPPNFKTMTTLTLEENTQTGGITLVN